VLHSTAARLRRPVILSHSSCCCGCPRFACWCWVVLLHAFAECCFGEHGCRKSKFDSRFVFGVVVGGLSLDCNVCLFFSAGILRAIVIPNSHFQSASPLHVLLCCVVLSSFGATIGLLRQVYVIFSRYATDDGSQTFYTASARGAYCCVFVLLGV
jgi:hypothetical protein